MRPVGRFLLEGATKYGEQLNNFGGVVCSVRVAPQLAAQLEPRKENAATRHETRHTNVGHNEEGH